MKDLMIIAYGNPLRGDDGIGWHAAERLLYRRWTKEVPILTRHQLTPELAERISEVQRVIFVDAHAGTQHGDVQARRVLPAAAFDGAFTHHLTPEALLAAARDLYGRAPEGVLISVTGVEFTLQDQLSAVALAALPKMLAEIEKYADEESTALRR